MMTVPPPKAASSQRSILPPAISMRVPVVSSAERVSSSSLETDAMEGSASPRNPRVAMESRSFTSRSLLVAWRSKASSASSRSMPQPSSTMRIRRRPPDSTSTRRSVEPASSEFSSSSLTTEAGRSTTSPAAILLATWSGRMRMRPMKLHYTLGSKRPALALGVDPGRERKFVPTPSGQGLGCGVGPEVKGALYGETFQATGRQPGFSIATREFAPIPYEATPRPQL
ncbi:hypothetical protein SBA4_1160002 [Candidatus Sulfopaludibacter sp. SbA4]|nr:hypothetical protein SBA4_1160002 [Candidatus Sulfopaludibacter sp. SbA4]